MKRVKIFSIITYLLIMIIAGVLAYFGITFRSWEFYLITILIILFGLFNRLEGELK